MIKLTRALLCLLVLVTGLLALFPATPVSAIAQPDTAPAINAVYGYENCLEDGDVGFLIDYYLDYAATPTEPTSDSYLVSFIDTDGVTQLSTVSPYPYNDNGYGRGVAWIYFTAAEVTANSIDSADIANYEIWLMGNPTVASGWTGDPPKTIAGIDQWNTISDPSTLIALRILYYADLLEVIWSVDLIESTAVGNRLSTGGASYFTNVIESLRTIAPACFSSTEVDPDYTPISYVTTFGATASNGTATITGAPVTLVEGFNTIDTGATTGTIIIDLAGWTFGTISDITGTIAGTPADLNPGINTFTVTGAGTFNVTVAEVTTVTVIEDSVIGTGLDLTTLAAAFGMSRWFLSGIVWMLITIIICAAVYRAESRRNGDPGISVGGSRAITLVFTVCVIGGSLLGLLHLIVSALLFIGCGVLIGYVFFFRSETLHKGFMFMVWMFVIVSIAGNVLAGSVAITATRLTADLSANETSTIFAANTTGFADSGIITIDDEHIGYPSKNGTAFLRTAVLGVTTNPILRGQDGTAEAAHASGATIRTREAGFLNASMDYKIARIADTAGVVGILTLPVKILDLILTFFVLPLDFLGTELAILTYIWVVIAAGMIVGFAIQLVGGRRV